MGVKKEKLRELYNLQAEKRGAIRWTDNGFKDQHLFFTQTVMGYLNTARLKEIELLISYVIHQRMQIKSDLKKALDLGCAEGFYTNKLSRAGFKYVIGTDISHVRIKRANVKRSINENFLICDAEHLPFQDEAFDFILCSEVLEHLPQPDNSLHEINRTLTQDGQLILTSPSSKSFVEKRSKGLPLLSISRDLETIIGQLARKAMYKLERKPKKQPLDRLTLRNFEKYLEHINVVDSKSLTHMLKRSGLELKIFSWSGFYVPFIPMSILLSISPKIVNRCERIFRLIKPEPFLWTMLVLCEKRASTRMSSQPKKTRNRTPQRCFTEISVESRILKHKE